jgi:outer membrane protein assembly factor BamD
MGNKIRIPFVHVCSVIVFSLLLGACSSSDKFDTSTPEGAFRQAEKLQKSERFEEAVAQFNEVKNKHPYSRFAVESKLKIADIEFERENFAEAEAAYKIFREYHPEHPKSDYVIFRLGKSVYEQLPSTIDRDLTLANSAIEHFLTLKKLFPNSSYVPEAHALQEKAEKMLAEKQNYIAQFYFIREKYDSALGRFEDILQLHRGSKQELSALYHATIASYRLKEMDKAKTYFKRLLAEYPNSNELALARKELADGF